MSDGKQVETSVTYTQPRMPHHLGFREDHPTTATICDLKSFIMACAVSIQIFLFRAGLNFSNSPSVQVSTH